jgi:transcriptional antiterminator Rof (Rho-off)
MSDYAPIACARYEALELAIMHGQWLRLTLREADVDAEAATELLVLPLDIGAADGAEWLRVRDAGGSERRLRLDGIEAVAPAHPATSASGP